jgi:hypothetical protein
VFVLGVLLRLSMLRRFSAHWGYDAGVYWDIVVWMSEHHSPFAPLEEFICAHHPPLYFFVVACLKGLGVSREQAVVFPVFCGIVRLALLWIGLRRYLPGKRWAHVFTLALAAVLPASVHIDGCLYPEPVNGMFAAAVMLVVPRVFPAQGRERWKLAAIAGVLIGLELLTKMTATVMILSVAVTIGLELWFSKPRSLPAIQSAGRHLAPWGAIVFLPALMAGWFYARNVPAYHKVFLTSYDTTEKSRMSPEMAKTSILDRRTLGFFVGWDSEIYKFPYNPTGLGEHPRFFTAAVASTFVDYYNQSFSGLPPFGPGSIRSTRHPLTPELVSTARFSMVGGTVLSIAMFAAWVACARRTLARKDVERAYLLVVPLVMTVLAIYTAMKYPFDDGGVIKGAYMQFGAPPLYAMCGLAFQWALSRKYLAPIAGLLVLSVVLVAGYTIYCRTEVLILPGLGSWYSPS